MLIKLNYSIVIIKLWSKKTSPPSGIPHRPAGDVWTNTFRLFCLKGSRLIITGQSRIKASARNKYDSLKISLRILSDINGPLREGEKALPFRRMKVRDSSLKNMHIHVYFTGLVIEVLTEGCTKRRLIGGKGDDYDYE